MNQLNYSRMKGPGDFDTPAELERDEQPLTERFEELFDDVRAEVFAAFMDANPNVADQFANWLADNAERVNDDQSNIKHALRLIRVAQPWLHGASEGVRADIAKAVRLLGGAK